MTGVGARSLGTESSYDAKLVVQAGPPQDDLS